MGCGASSALSASSPKDGDCDHSFNTATRIDSDGLTKFNNDIFSMQIDGGKKCIQDGLSLGQLAAARNTSLPPRQLRRLNPESFTSIEIHQRRASEEVTQPPSQHAMNALSPEERLLSLAPSTGAPPSRPPSVPPQGLSRTQAFLDDDNVLFPPLPPLQ